MILKRVSLEHYGCFGAAEFEFRRGMNLISGGNEAGKTLLLTAVAAGLFGVEHGSRLRSWGDSLSCRVTLHFEGSDGGLRLTRDLENNLVRVEESAVDGAWQESFTGMVPPAGPVANRADYQQILERRLQVGSEALLRLLLDAGHAQAVFSDDGRQAARLIAEVTSHAETAGPVPVAAVDDSAERQREIAALEAELAADRADYAKGEKYLAWIRKKYGMDGKAPSPPPKKAIGKAARDRAALERRRDELQAELRKQGLPPRLPADLPALFEAAEKLRQELSALQVELTPLQRRRQALKMPGAVWPVLLTLAGGAASGGAYWLKAPWFLPLAAGCAALVLLAWSIFLVAFNRARGVRDGLDQELQIVEQKRADALARQSELAEQFEAYGLSSTPVEMVKLQQLCARNEVLIHRYQDACAQLGDDASAVPGEATAPVAEGHLRPEEIPDAEARLAELGESLRRRESRLAALRDGTAALRAITPAEPCTWSELELLRCIAQQMERLTGGRHVDLRLRDERLQLEAQPGKWTVPASCSRGTVECLALATRLAVSQMTGGRLPLPLDDLPAHLDSRRRQAVLQVLERHAADHQLLLASNDEDLGRRGARERWHIVNLNPKAPQRPATEEEASDAGQLHLL